VQKCNKTNATWQYARAANSYGQAVILLRHSMQWHTDTYTESSQILLGSTRFEWRQHARAL